MSAFATQGGHNQQVMWLRWTTTLAWEHTDRKISDKTRMWANDQCDGHPAKYRWHLLFNAAQFGNAAKTRNPLKFAGVPETPKQIFFQLSIRALVAKIQPDKVVPWCRDGDFFASCISASCVRYISDVHSKFALRPHHVWKYGRHPVCDRWD